MDRLEGECLKGAYLRSENLILIIIHNIINQLDNIVHPLGYAVASAGAVSVVVVVEPLSSTAPPVRSFSTN